MKNIAVQTGILESILQASPIVQLTLLILIVLSILCWAVGVRKYVHFGKISEANEPFLAKFAKATSLDALFENIDQFSGSPAAKVFAAGYEEMKRLAASQSVSAVAESSAKLAGLDNLERIIYRAIDKELAEMESNLNILATTGSTGPFIGLFGTVWGIMSSFHKIGQTGSASLAVVAPGISEALVATAIGLAAAIPAVALFNHFISQTKKQEIVLNDFGVDFLNMVKRHFGRY